MTEKTLEAVRKDVTVPLPLDRAFALFTEGMATWWPATHSIAEQPFEQIVVEPRAGGRWFERAVDGSECEWGTVLAFEPPGRLLLAWQVDPDWRFEAELARASEVEIRFSAEGDAATHVELVHRGFERHGERHEEIHTGVAGENGWSAVLASYRAAA